jgi:CheY-like chemotaxis protein
MKTVLVIEDNQAIRENTVELLELQGFRVASAPDGRSGLQLIRQIKPDSVLCDISMPDMDGYEVLNELRSQQRYERLPFYFMSAKSELSDRQKGIDMGATGYLIKPFTERELLECFD